MKKQEKRGKGEEGEWLLIKTIYNKQWKKTEEKSKFYKEWRDWLNKKKSLHTKVGELLNVNKLLLKTGNWEKRNTRKDTS